MAWRRGGSRHARRFARRARPVGAMILGAYLYFSFWV